MTVRHLLCFYSQKKTKHVHSKYLCDNLSDVVLALEVVTLPYQKLAIFGTKNNDQKEDRHGFKRELSLCFATFRARSISLWLGTMTWLTPSRGRMNVHLAFLISRLVDSGRTWLRLGLEMVDMSLSYSDQRDDSVMWVSTAHEAAMSRGEETKSQRGLLS